MSHFSIEDFNKLKEIFNQYHENVIWDSFVDSNFNFNITLEKILSKDRDYIKDQKDNTQKEEDTSSLINRFFKKKEVSFNYQKLD